MESDRLCTTCFWRAPGQGHSSTWGLSIAGREVGVTTLHPHSAAVRLAPDVVCVCVCVKLGDPAQRWSAKGFSVKGFSVLSQLIQGRPPHLITCDTWSQQGAGTWVGAWRAPLPCGNPAQRVKRVSQSHPAPVRTPLPPLPVLCSLPSLGEGPLSTNSWTE